MPKPIQPAPAPIRRPLLFQRKPLPPVSVESLPASKVIRPPWPLQAPSADTKKAVAALELRKGPPPRVAVPTKPTPAAAPDPDVKISGKPLPIEVSNKLIELETARVRKNTYDRLLKRVEKEALELCVKHKVKDRVLQLMAKDVDNTDVAMNVSIEEINPADVVTETIDKAALKRLTTPEVYELCTVAQKGLIVEHAGGAVAKKCIATSTSDGGEPFLKISSKKVPK